MNTMPRQYLVDECIIIETVSKSLSDINIRKEVGRYALTIQFSTADEGTLIGNIICEKDAINVYRGKFW